MNRRNFLKFLGVASVGATVAYSFPSIIVPKNIITLDEVSSDLLLKDGTSLSYINSIIQKEIWPKVINDHFFTDTPFLVRMRNNLVSNNNEEELERIKKRDISNEEFARRYFAFQKDLKNV